MRNKLVGSGRSALVPPAVNQRVFSARGLQTSVLL